LENGVLDVLHLGQVLKEVFGVLREKEDVVG
jgi:hypothetical protein